MSREALSYGEYPKTKTNALIFIFIPQLLYNHQAPKMWTRIER